MSKTASKSSPTFYAGIAQQSSQIQRFLPTRELHSLANTVSWDSAVAGQRDEKCKIFPGRSLHQQTSVTLPQLPFSGASTGETSNHAPACQAVPLQAHPLHPAGAKFRPARHNAELPAQAWPQQQRDCNTTATAERPLPAARVRLQHGPRFQLEECQNSLEAPQTGSQLSSYSELYGRLGTASAASLPVSALHGTSAGLSGSRFKMPESSTVARPLPALHFASLEPPNSQGNVPEASLVPSTLSMTGEAPQNQSGAQNAQENLQGPEAEDNALPDALEEKDVLPTSSSGKEICGTGWLQEGLQAVGRGAHISMPLMSSRRSGQKRRSVASKGLDILFSPTECASSTAIDPAKRKRLNELASKNLLVHTIDFNCGTRSAHTSKLYFVSMSSSDSISVVSMPSVGNKLLQVWQDSLLLSLGRAWRPTSHSFKF